MKWAQQNEASRAPGEHNKVCQSPGLALGRIVGTNYMLPLFAAGVGVLLPLAMLFRVTPGSSQEPGRSHGVGSRLDTIWIKDGSIAGSIQDMGDSPSTTMCKFQVLFPDSSIPATKDPGIQLWWKNDWVPAMPMGDPDWVPRCQCWPGPVLANVGMWGWIRVRVLSSLPAQWISKDIIIFNKKP